MTITSKKAATIAETYRRSASRVAIGRFATRGFRRRIAVTGQETTAATAITRQATRAGTARPARSHHRTRTFPSVQTGVHVFFRNISYHPSRKEILGYGARSHTTEYDNHIDSILPLTITKAGREQEIHVDMKNIDMEDVAAPGDVLPLGNFKKDS